MVVFRFAVCISLFLEGGGGGGGRRQGSICCAMRFGSEKAYLLIRAHFHLKSMMVMK